MNEHSATAVILIIGLAVVAWGIAAVIGCVLRARDKKHLRIPRHRGRP